MKYVQIIKGKEIQFTFKNKGLEFEYIKKCELIWGCVPCDVNWAIETNIYKNAI